MIVAPHRRRRAASRQRRASRPTARRRLRPGLRGPEWSLHRGPPHSSLEPDGPGAPSRGGGEPVAERARPRVGQG
ncbi:MAG: hypothetical protein MZW92_57230 [Comamonadaceae bacterium]|nr:hypothetical protein [Comamonadaceae bacterium]